MRRFLIITALSAATLAAPAIADARDACQQRNHDRKVTGTVLGAVGGALVGGAVTHGAVGPIVGGVAGAAVGNNVARIKCNDERTYFRSSRKRYADNGRCHYERRTFHNSRGRAYERDIKVCS